MSSIKTLAVVGVIALLICGYEVSSQEVGIGEDCAVDLHCAPNVGLICGEEDKKCACGSGPLNHEYKFTMEWDTGKGLCVAVEGSACVGTGANPVSEGEKGVQCKTGVCNQLASMPPGVGVCGEGGSGAERITSFGMLLSVATSCLLLLRN